MIPAGKRDRLVEILRETVTGQDVLGQDIVARTVWQSVWMGKSDFTAAEKFRSQQEIASETVVWPAPWIAGLSTSDQLRYEGKTYDIESISEIGRRQGMEITATAIRV